jgi:hypothetical protein
MSIVQHIHFMTKTKPPSKPLDYCYLNILAESEQPKKISKYLYVLQQGGHEIN